MSGARFAGPRGDPWTVAVHGGDPGHTLGAGVVIDDRRVLTTAHVVEDELRKSTTLFVTFPKAGLPRTVRRRVRRVRMKKRETDVAILELVDPVPPEVTPAPLRSPRPADLIGDRWWAFGFPRDTDYGADAHGVVGAPLAYGWVRLDTSSRYGVRPGFSGTGLWSDGFQAVVGLVGQAQRAGEHRGDALAVTLHQIVQEFPDDGLAALSAWSLAAVGESALEAWGWSLDTDAEAVRHWRPRARGVSIDSESGYRFRGRRVALTEIVEWLQRPVPDRRVLVVTGSPGVGKSAVLGRIVTTADVGVQDALPDDDNNVCAPLGSIACAVHAKGKTAMDVATEVARAASVRMPRIVEDLAPALRRMLERRRGRAFNLVLDALDEAISPAQARLIITSILIPIAQTCARFGAQVVVGTRHQDDGGSLLRAFGRATKTIDLDDERYFAQGDLADYALATLSLVGDERAGNPYTNVHTATPVARRIAALAEKNFLIAGLVARAHGLYDAEPIDPTELAFTPTVDDALAEYMKRLPPVERVPAAAVLTALAFAVAPGLSVELWQVALAALGSPVGHTQLAEFAGSSAANFIVESSSDGNMLRYRLFHQALNDALLRARAGRVRESDQRAIATGLIAHGRHVGWAACDPYLLRVLPIYADRAKMIDILLADDSYLLHADLPRLTQLAEHATNQAGRARARLLHLTPQAIVAPPAERVALFGVTCELEQLGNSFADWRGVPYRARWASAKGRVERAVLEGHAGAVRAICPITVDGQTFIAAVGDYRSVRLWDPASGRYHGFPLRHHGSVLAVCAFIANDLALLATAGQDGVIHIWDAATGRHQGALRGHAGPIRALCAIRLEGHALVASGGDDRTVRLWDLGTGRHRILAEHADKIRAICPVPLGKHLFLATGGDDYTARLSDPVDGRLMRTFHGHIDSIRAVWPVKVGGSVWLSTASYRTAHLWEIETGAKRRAFEGHTGAIRAIATIVAAGQDLLATAGDDSAIRIWDPDGGPCKRVLTGHADAITTMCTVPIEDRTLLATASRDRTVRLWDLATGQDGPGPEDRSKRISAVCPVNLGARQLVAMGGEESRRIRLVDVETGDELGGITNSAGGTHSVCAVRNYSHDLVAVASGDDAMEVWDPSTGLRLPQRIREFGGLRAFCSVEKGGRSLLVTAGHPRKVIQLWDPLTGRQLRGTSIYSFFGAYDMRRSHARAINAIHQFVLDGDDLLATAGSDNVIMIWTLSGQLVRTLQGHNGPVWAVTSVVVDESVLLATASSDQTIRVWDPATGSCQSVLAGHTDRVNTICAVTVYDKPMIASGSQDRTVRIWDLSNRSQFLSIPVHHPALACVEVSELLFVGLTAGSLVVDINPDRHDLAYFREV
jgi:WD40 repeat protein